MGKLGAVSFDNSVRLSDADRNNAVAALGEALGEGRIDFEEFDKRCATIAKAQYQRELIPLFKDLPQDPIMHTPMDKSGEAFAITGELPVKYYSASEIARAREAGRKPKLGIALISTFAGLFLSPFLITAGIGAGHSILGIGAGLLALLLIPTVWIALFLLKVGPESWHMPSPRQVERERQREIMAMTAEQRALMRAQETQMWAARRQQAGELTGDALELAKRKLGEWNKK